MKRKCLLVLLGLLALALAAAPALAGTVSFVGNHAFTITDLTPDSEVSLALSAQANGVAFGSLSQFGDSGVVTGNPANAAIPTGPYLVTTQAATFATYPSLTMSQTMVANAPDAIFGSTYQGTNNDALHTVTVNAAPGGFFVLGITDIYSQNFSLANGGTPPYWAFSNLSTYSDLYATLTDVTTGGSNFTQSVFNLLTYSVDNQGLPLDSFTGNSTPSSLDFVMFLTGVHAGDTLTLELNLASSQSGASAFVPLPPSLLLLGSGLGGLFLARRFRRG